MAAAQRSPRCFDRDARPQGWVPKTADRDGTYAHLNMRVPDELKYGLHVLLVEHGKVYKNGVTELKKMASAVSEAGASSGERHLAAGHDGVHIKEEVKAEAPPVKQVD